MRWTGARRGARRNDRRRPLHERPGDQPAGLPAPTGPGSSGTARRRRIRSTSWSSPSCEALRINPSPPCRRFGLPAPGLSRRDRPAPRARRGAGLPGRSRSGEAGQAGRSPGRAARVRRFLGPEVGRPAAQRREDDGREGSLGLPALAARPDRRATCRSTRWSRQIVAGLGSTWQNPPAELPPHQPRPDDRRRERQPGLPGHPPPVRPLPQSPVRRLDPGRLLRPGGLLRQCRPQADQQRRAGTASTSTRSTATRSSIWRAAPRSSSPAPGKLLEPTLAQRDRTGRSGSREATMHSIGWPIWLTREQPPVQPEPGQPRLVSPDGPGHRRAGRRLPRVEPAVQPGAPGRRHALFRCPRHAAQAAGRLDHEVADLPAERDADPTNAEDEANFSHAAVRLLPAEVLLDAISQVLDVPERFPRRTRGRSERPSCRAPCGGVAFLKTFGKPDRLLDLRMRAVRGDDAGPGVPDDQRRDGPAQARATRSTGSAELPRRGSRVMRDLLRRGLSRRALPRADGRPSRRAMPAPRPSRRSRGEAWEDVVWASCNSKEFLLRH